MILSSGKLPELNQYGFYDSTKKMYLAFRATGIKRDNITTMYDDGKGGNNTVMVEGSSWARDAAENTKLISVPRSLEGDTTSDMKNPATPAGINASFDDLVKKIKAGDHLVLFITGHGNQEKGVVLWEGQYYKSEDLKKQLNKLPKDVTTHIITNICYGGQLNQLTNKNVCVIANADNKHTHDSLPNISPIITGFTDVLKNRETKLSLLEAFTAAKAVDLDTNKYSQTSLDYFLEKNSPKKNKLEVANCYDDPKGSLASLQKEISAISEHLSQDSGPQKNHYEKYLKEQLKKINYNLNLIRNTVKEHDRVRNQLALDKLQKEWSSSSKKDQEQLRPKITLLAEKLKKEDEAQNTEITNLTKAEKQTLAEMRFLKSATASQLEDYYAIRKCLDYEM